MLLDAMDPAGERRADMRMGLATAHIMSALTRRQQKVKPLTLDTEPKSLAVQSQEDMAANIARLKKWNAKRKALNEHNQQT